MEKFRNKYRIQSTRMPGWDYSRGGKYFVTVCTHNRICYFGEVVNGKMLLNETGEIVKKFWLEIPTCFPDTFLDESQIMPNHFHGIIVMKRSSDNTNTKQPNKSEQLECKSLECRSLECRSLECRDETGSRLYVPPSYVPPFHVPPPFAPEKIIRNKKMSAISPKPGSLPVIIGGWKSKCSKVFKKMPDMVWNGWQSRYNDHIIRNDGELNRIRKYIINNPSNWKGDEFFRN